MRWFNILQGLAALAATAALVALSYYNIFYAAGSVLLFYVGRRIFIAFQKRKEKIEAKESAPWHTPVE